MTTKYVRIEATGLEGVREITAAGWDGRILRMTREAYLKWRKTGAEKLGSACAYVLLADDFAKATPPQRFLYVGQIGAAPHPGDVQDKDRPFWSIALVFTSAGAWMDARHALAVQRSFIEWAREADRYEVSNVVAPARHAVDGPPDQLVQAYLDPVRAVLEFAGIDVFQFNPEGLYVLARGARLGRHDKAKARILSASGKTIELYQDSRLTVNQLPETVDKVEALEAQGAVTFDRAAGYITFTRATRLEAQGAFDTILGTFPKDWLNKRRRSIRDAFDAHEAATRPVVVTSMLSPEPEPLEK